MKAVYSTFKRRKPMKRTVLKKPVRLYGLPKREVTRRLSGVNLSLHSEEAEIVTALGHIEDFLAYVRRLPCGFCYRTRNSEAHHVMTRGARNPDFYNTLPACAAGFDSCHADIHAGKYAEINQPAFAVMLTQTYLIDHPTVARWLEERGVDAPDLL